jgi:hypothetical protein
MSLLLTARGDSRVEDPTGLFGNEAAPRDRYVAQRPLRGC